MNAASAAYCAGTGGQTVKLPAMTSTARRSRSGTSSQPSRQPVIDQYFENDVTTSASCEVLHALAVGGASPYSMPW